MYLAAWDGYKYIAVSTLQLILTRSFLEVSLILHFILLFPAVKLFTRTSSAAASPLGSSRKMMLLFCWLVVLPAALAYPTSKYDVSTMTVIFMP